MTDNQGNVSTRNQTAVASINDYEYLSNFKLGYFENLSHLDRLVDGVSYCMKFSYSENHKLNENRLLKCYQLRSALLHKADKLNLFD